MADSFGSSVGSRENPSFSVIFSQNFSLLSEFLEYTIQDLMFFTLEIASI